MIRRLVPLALLLMLGACAPSWCDQPWVLCGGGAEPRHGDHEANGPSSAGRGAPDSGAEADPEGAPCRS